MLDNNNQYTDFYKKRFRLKARSSLKADHAPASGPLCQKRTFREISDLMISDLLSPYR